MKARRHHNNDGRKQIKNGKTRKDAERLRKELCKNMCPEHKKMGIYACSDRTQCWESCGDLGNDEKHIKVTNIKALPKIDY